MEHLYNAIPAILLLAAGLRAYWKLQNTAENNSNKVSDVKDDCYARLCDERQRSDERDAKHDKEIENLWRKMDERDAKYDKERESLLKKIGEKASKDALIEIKQDIGKQYSELSSDFKSLRDYIMQVITKK